MYVLPNVCETCVIMDYWPKNPQFLTLQLTHGVHGDNEGHKYSRPITLSKQPYNANAQCDFSFITVSNCVTFLKIRITGPRRAVCNASGNRCESDCRSRGHEFDPGPVPYFHGDWSWNNFYGHSPPFRWIIQEGLLSVTSESMCTKYWLTACSSLPRKKCG